MFRFPIFLNFHLFLESGVLQHVIFSNWGSGPIRNRSESSNCCSGLTRNRSGGLVGRAGERGGRGSSVFRLGPGGAAGERRGSLERGLGWEEWGPLREWAGGGWTAFGGGARGGDGLQGEAERDSRTGRDMPRCWWC